MTSVCEKVKLQKTRKTKYSILASILHIFLKNFLTAIRTYRTLHKSYDFYKFRHIFQKIKLFRKIHFVFIFKQGYYYYYYYYYIIIIIIIIIIINIISY